ncbi:MAG: maleylacetate reductase [Alphaproteobacteria bacterium]|jgi:maleylacetate reductase|nr:maleylacetate reductase [Alphaproteobacteria bacterium]MBU0804237.1 maleylacetate reductase [Alphaproteobacteria bacterium]MBU0871068.1 maleylacetate reductase [Alphaproteobacteria bacterium]MBU1400823.1 maleylacetate reductase [Alphaproteobacteria bacterium]MBU1592760.1 maleylacetate reductase [Alphaproteobacteria bacterium]
MMDSFTFPGLTTRVVFGSGTMERTEEEVRRLGHDKAMVLSTEHQKEDAERLAASLGDLSAGTFSGAVMHTPVEVTEKAVEIFRTSGATAVVSLGGGSTVGLGKAIALRTGADQVVIPTTYAGSEMTDILGETSAGEKTTRRSPDIRPETVIYDVDLTLGLPVELTVTSAMNAIAHAMEALYAPDRNPVTVLMCKDAMAAFREAIPRLIDDPRNRTARAQALYSAWCCSTALGHSSMALHHKLAHVFGGSFDTPHAETHAILLPYTTAFNEAAVPDLLRPIADAFGGRSAGGAIWDFAQSVGSPLSLKDIGIQETDLDRAATIAVKNAYANPRPIDLGSIRELLQAAWEARRPGGNE